MGPTYEDLMDLAQRMKSRLIELASGYDEPIDEVAPEVKECDEKGIMSRIL